MTGRQGGVVSFARITPKKREISGLISVHAWRKSICDLPANLHSGNPHGFNKMASRFTGWPFRQEG
jgi:hypothetical protein